MALQKQPIDIKFAQGLDTKTDSKQVPIGKFLALQNSVFDTVGQLTKRPGNALITTLPTTLQTNFLTLNDNLITTGQNILAYSEDTNQWLNEGVVQPVHLSVQELVRTNTSQSSQDSATAPNGLVCLTYIDSGAAYYQISDSITGQQIVQRTALPATSSMPKVFVLGNYFIVTFYATVSGSTHLQYIAISINTLTASPAAVNFSSSVYNSSQPHDGVVVAGNLYLAWISAFGLFHSWLHGK